MRLVVASRQGEGKEGHPSYLEGEDPEGNLGQEGMVDELHKQELRQ